MEVTLRHLRVFCRAVESGNFTHAAVALHMTQSGVSRSVSELEKLINRKLFARLGRRLELTDEGADLYGQLSALLGDLDAIVEGANKGKVRLGFTWLLPEAWVNTLFPRVAKQSGVTVEPTSCDDPLSALRDGTCDVVLFPGGADDDRLTTRIVARHRQVAVVPMASALARSESVRWNELVRHPIVVNRYVRWPRPELWRPRPADASLVWCRNFIEVLELVATGRGVSTACEVARERAPHPDVVYVDIVDAPPFELSMASRTTRITGSLRSFWEEAADLPDQGLRCSA